MLPERSAGILLPMTSLPSRYGIGDMGAGARRFIDFLKNAGQRVWQMLPVTKPGLGNSPYYSLSSRAGNPLLIDLEALVREGLLEETDLTAARADTADIADGRLHENIEICTCSDSCVDYDTVAARKMPLLEKAAAAWRAKQPEAAASPTDEIIQYFFERQWQALKEYANGQGILLVGDVPFYVAPDSGDVREHPELFQLDGDGNPAWIAGVPPDYFSATGQVWNNPVYDWTGHREDLIDWWVTRIRRNLGLFDLVRLDHFRGFASYWAIPAGAENAVEGHWEKGPGIAFFDALRCALYDAQGVTADDTVRDNCSDPNTVHETGSLPLIAEDLGDIDDEVRALLGETGLPGMKVLQFAFGAGDGNDHLPHNYWTDNCVCYTGTHDNDTIRGWFEHAPEHARWHAVNYLGCEEAVRREAEVNADSDADAGNGADAGNDAETAFPAITEAVIRAAMHSPAALAVVPMQDALGLGSEARMNTPGTAQGNWRWRVTDDQLSDVTAARLRRWAQEAGRC